MQYLPELRWDVWIGILNYFCFSIINIENFKPISYIYVNEFIKVLRKILYFLLSFYMCKKNWNYYSILINVKSVLQKIKIKKKKKKSQN
jgi:hypothetical protein